MLAPTWVARSDDMPMTVARQLKRHLELTVECTHRDAGFTPCSASLHCSCTFSVQILPPPPVGIFDITNRPKLIYVLK